MEEKGLPKAVAPDGDASAGDPLAPDDDDDDADDAGKVSVIDPAAVVDADDVGLDFGDDGGSNIDDEAVEADVLVDMAWCRECNIMPAE